MNNLEVDSINDIQDVTKNSDGTYAIKYKKYKSKSGARLVSTSWTNVPHYSKKGKLLTNEEYKTQTIAKYGKQYFAQTEECVGGETIINTLEFSDITMRSLFEKDIFC